SCRQNCNNSLCIQTNGSCTEGCIVGHWGVLCQNDCPSNCKNSVCGQSDRKCTDGCVPGKYGEYCDQACPQNCNNSLCIQTNGFCTEGCIAGHWGVLCQNGCPANCYWTDTCQMNCSTNCIESTCSISTGSCVKGCRDGYRGHNCSDGCPYSNYGDQCNLSCGHCDGVWCNLLDGTCPGECKDQYTGPKCNKSCDGCTDSSCNKNGCTRGCVPGKHGDYCDQPCPRNCKDNVCGQNDRKCKRGCFPGKHGDYCDKSCPQNCKDNVCGQNDRKCKRGCFPGKHGDYCDKSCLPNCKDNVCGQNDRKCTTGCDPGQYGPYCDKSCPPNCENNICEQSGGSCSSCKRREFWKSDCSVKCPSTCVGSVCFQQNGTCSKCGDGYWGASCNYSCSATCNNSVCGRQDGMCTEGCAVGHWEDECLKKCPDNCKNSVCEQQNGHCTEGCTVGHWGDECLEKCPDNCNNSVCGQQNGHCTEGCAVGNWGDECRKECPDNCKNSVCEQLNGNCTDGCMTGYWTVTCQMNCSTNCIESTCSIFTGSCVNGCQNGYQGQNCSDACEDGKYGRDCSEQCGNCLGGNASCYHITGSCLQGCQETFDGHSCRMPVVTESPDQTGIIVGAVIGVIAVAVVGLGIAIFIIRRRKLQNKKPDTFKKSNEVTFSSIEEKKQRATTDEHHDDSTVDVSKNLILNGGAVGAVYANCTTDADIEYNNTTSSPRGILVEDLKKPHSADLWSLFSTRSRRRETNIPKNRFRAIYPYDHSRVRLKVTSNDPDSDYINANYIDGCESEKEYIAATGPKPNTIHDTWAMVVQQKCGKIVMLTNLMEGEKKKCERYWPLAGEPMKLGDITLTLTSEEERSFYTIRSISVRFTEAEKTKTIVVQQLHFTSWPDHDVADPRHLAVFHRRVTSSHTSLPGPLLVHCSAGIGRTGTFIGLDALVTYGRLHKRIDIPWYVAKMRKDRMNMVQTAAQLQLLHDALYEALMYPGSSIPRADFARRHGQLKKQIQKEYQILQTMLLEYSPEVYSQARRKENVSKNRDQSVLPLDDHRLILDVGVGRTENYINAVVVSGSVQNTKFLVTHLPMSHTMVDFWRMVSDQDSNVVVVLNPCDTKKSTRDTGYMDNMTDSFQNDDSKHTVKVLQASSWPPGRELPPSKDMILDLMASVDKWQVEKGVTPIIVQCMNGVQCSGLYCAVSKVIQQIKVDQEVDVFQAVREMQICRPEFIQSEVQYSFCYDVVLEYFIRSESNIYANM
ncbi:hypothetical protein ScPMuIL_000060, partial [Solemya velum]